MKSRQQLQREIAERAAALTAQQQQWQQQRIEQRQQRRASLASPKLLAGSFATGIALGLLGGRRRKKQTDETKGETTTPSLLSRTARELWPIAQPLLLSAATQWWQQRQHHGPDDESEHKTTPAEQ